MVVVVWFSVDMKQLSVGVLVVLSPKLASQTPPPDFLSGYYCFTSWPATRVDAPVFGNARLPNSVASLSCELVHSCV